jgi:hypothetical protein
LEANYYFERRSGPLDVYISSLSWCFVLTTKNIFDQRLRIAKRTSGNESPLAMLPRVANASDPNKFRRYIGRIYIWSPAVEIGGFLATVREINRYT